MTTNDNACVTLQTRSSPPISIQENCWMKNNTALLLKAYKEQMNTIISQITFILHTRALF